MSKIIKDYKGFTKVNENDDDKPFRLYGTGATPEAELIELVKSLITDIKKSNPKDQESYNIIKDNIRNKSSLIKRHPKLEDFKHGFQWQDTFIKLSDWQGELKSAVLELNKKAQKNGLI